MSSTLAVTKATILSSTLTVSKAVTLNSTLTVENDVSMNSNVDISGDLVINGNLEVKQHQNTSVINTTVNDYQLIVTEDLSLNGELKVSGDASFNSNLDITGTLSHNGLVMTTGTEIDQIKSFSKTLSPTLNTWFDTGISGTDLSTGIYLLSLIIDDNSNGGSHYNETYTGTVSWYSGTTNSTDSDEIQLHRSGENPNSGTIYLRTIRTLSNGTLKLQIYSNKSITSYTYVFKFRRFM